MALEEDQRISEVVRREQSRLRNFIRRRVPDPRDAEDILQDVFYKLVEANRLLMPIEHVTAWLFRVARNCITDLFRKRVPESFGDPAVADEDDEMVQLEDLLPSPDAGPEAVYARHVLLDELELAVDELPEEQRAVFVAHELEGRSFKEIAAETGVSVNTLLSRKRYAVLRLRRRLQSIYDESSLSRRLCWGLCCSPSSAAKWCSSCGIGCCRHSSAGLTSPSGKRSDFWRSAGSSSVDLDVTVALARVQQSAVAWPIEWPIAWRNAGSTWRPRSVNDSGSASANGAASTRPPARARGNEQAVRERRLRPGFRLRAPASALRRHIRP